GDVLRDTFGLARDGKVNPRRNLPEEFAANGVVVSRLSRRGSVAGTRRSGGAGSVERPGTSRPCTGVSLPLPVIQRSRIPLDSPVEIGTAGVPRMSATPYHRAGGGQQAGRGGRRRPSRSRA